MQYADCVRPLLHENSLLADTLLDLAADRYHDKTTAAQLKSRWTQDIVPLADHLHAQAALVSPPSSWIERHKALVNIWGSRADAYQDLSLAVHLGEADRWKQASASADEAKIAEERWFRDTNRELAQWNLALDQFP